MYFCLRELSCMLLSSPVAVHSPGSADGVGELVCGLARRKQGCVAAAALSRFDVRPPQKGLEPHMST